MPISAFLASYFHYVSLDSITICRGKEQYKLTKSWQPREEGREGNKEAIFIC